MKVNAYAALKPGAPLEPFEYELGPIGPHEVDIAVEHCGICHSDLSMIDNEWNMAKFPLVPGHEAIGTIAAVGNLVTHLKVGDKVGLGWNSGCCNHCSSCFSGDHNLCENISATIVGRHGAFADRVRAQAECVLKLPEGLNPAKAGPLFCGGITVFNPLVQHNVSPTGRAAVIGIGGLGHMAIKFMRAWGLEVTAFTSSNKQVDAHHIMNSRDTEKIAAMGPTFDFILSTVNVKLDWDAYLSTLKPKGRLHIVGAVLDPLDISVFSLLPKQASISSSPVGSQGTITKMLEFAARHNIEPTTEHFPMHKVNNALDHLRAGKAHYRIVLDA